MERCTTRAEFCQALEAIAEGFAEELWTTVVETGSAGADAWVRTHGGAWLRRALGVALSARAERLGVSEVCGCGGAVTFRQRRPTRVRCCRGVRSRRRCCTGSAARVSAGVGRS